MEAIERIGFSLDIQLREFDRTVWVARVCAQDLRNQRRFDSKMRLAGKSPFRDLRDGRHDRLEKYYRHRAGNDYPEAILQSLNELIDRRSKQSDF